MKKGKEREKCDGNSTNTVRKIGCTKEPIIKSVVNEVPDALATKQPTSIFFSFNVHTTARISRINPPSH